MKQTLKATVAIIGVIVAVGAFWCLIIGFMWLCYEAGIPM